MIPQLPLTEISAGTKRASAQAESGKVQEIAHKPQDESHVASFSHLLGEERDKPAAGGAVKTASANGETPVTAEMAVTPIAESGTALTGLLGSAVPEGMAATPETIAPEQATGQANSIEIVTAKVGATSAATVDAAVNGVPVAGPQTVAVPVMEGATDVAVTGSTPARQPATSNPSSGQPRMELTLAAERPVPAVTGSDATAITGSKAAVPGHPATVTASGSQVISAVDSAQATAQALESAVKAHDTYGKGPVVSESQMLAGSLKQEQRMSAGPEATTAAANQTGQIRLAPESLMTESRSAVAAEQTSPDTAVATGQSSAETGAKMTTDAAPAATGGNELKAPDAPQAIPADRPVAEPEPMAVDAPGPEDSVLSSVEASVERGAVNSGAKTSAEAVVSSSVSRKVHSQVVRHFANTLNSVGGQEKVLIKLNPESLGQIELRFEGVNDRLSVVMSASTPQAEAALRENMQDLTERIMERSARFNHVDVRVEVRENGEPRQDGRTNDKNDGRQEQRRGTDRDENEHGSHGQEHRRGEQSQAGQQSWEHAMSWQLAEEAASEEG